MVLPYRPITCPLLAEARETPAGSEPREPHGLNTGTGFLNHSLTSGASMTNPKEQRSKKSILIDRDFQGRIVFFIVLAGFVCIAINAYLYYSYVVDSYDFILKHSSLPQEIIDERYRELYSLWVSLSLLDLLIILVIATWALVITHRAAGPVYHIKRVIAEIRSGNTKARVHLREKDEFQDLAKSFNEMMDELQKK